MATCQKKTAIYHHYSCSGKNVHKHPCDARLIPSDKLDQIAWKKTVLNKEIAATQVSMAALKVNTKSIVIPVEQILSAVTFDQKRAALLKTGITVSAFRDGKDKITLDLLF